MEIYWSFTNTRPQSSWAAFFPRGFYHVISFYSRQVSHTLYSRSPLCHEFAVKMFASLVKMFTRSAHATPKIGTRLSGLEDSWWSSYGKNNLKSIFWLICVLTMLSASAGPVTGARDGGSVNPSDLQMIGNKQSNDVVQWHPRYLIFDIQLRLHHWIILKYWRSNSKYKSPGIYKLQILFKDIRHANSVIVLIRFIFELMISMSSHLLYYAW